MQTFEYFSTTILCVCKHLRLWRICAFAQACLRICYLTKKKGVKVTYAGLLSRNDSHSIISIPDTDECMEPSSCSQKCVNIKRSYKCLCDDGYQILPDNKHCAALRSESNI